MNEKNKEDFYEDIYKEILDNIYDAVYYVDKDRKILYWNKAASAISGFDKYEVIGSYCYNNILNHIDEKGKNLCLTKCPLALTIEDGKPRKNNIYLHHKEGYRIPVSVKVTPLKDEKGRITGAIEIFNDNMISVLGEEKMKFLARMAYIDSLTDLSNRVYAIKKFDSIKINSKKNHYNSAIILIKIEDPEKYSPHLDKILKAISMTLKNNMIPGETISYWGEYRFIIFIENTNISTLRNFTSKIKQLINQSFIKLENNNLYYTVSLAWKFIEENDNLETIIVELSEMIKNQDKD